MSRSDDLDRLYGALVFLCDEARFLEAGDQYALMLAFNLVAELHTPSKIIVDEQEALEVAASSAIDLATSLAATASGIDEIVRLRAAGSLLRTVLRSWSPPLGERS